MRTRVGLAISIIAGGTLVGAIGCDDETNTTPTGTTTTGTTTTGSGTTTTGGGTTSGTPSGTTTGTGGGTGGGQAYDPCPNIGADHLLISEVSSHGPAGAGGGSEGGNYEFIEIWNPTSQAVTLDNYYLSDNNVYYRIAYGEPFTPQVSRPNTDFLVQFPAGTTIGANDVLVIQAGPDFEAAWPSADCPDFALGMDTEPSCGSGSVPLMDEPTNGDRGLDPGYMLSNTREMVVLFCWDGTSTIVKDVDYLPWGDTDETPSRVNKTGQPGYLDDTPIADQEDAPRYYTGGGGGPIGESLGRCNDTETGEATQDGNGPDGHDETSEAFATTISVNTTGSPGVVNTCP